LFNDRLVIEQVCDSSFMAAADYTGEGKSVVIGKELRKNALARYVEERGLIN
jgi:hypothetical protein